MVKSNIAPIITCLIIFALILSSPAWSSCTLPKNAIEKENCLPGTSKSIWDVSGAGDASIQGFTDNISINVGQSINFKIKATANYQLAIYRMGYYKGDGARLITTLPTTPRTQPACLTNNSLGLYDCGNWGVSATWSVPSNTVSGIYFAHAVRNDTGGASNIFFIVRNDASHSDILFQASDTTWQAYNDSINGQNLYTDDACGHWAINCRSFKVSYNRPFNTRTFEAASWLMNAEYPMIRWLEANGYDVSYFTDTDSDRNGTLIRNHKIWMSNGHDEYWSGQQRTNVENARNSGVNLAFFSANTLFWKIRWENSIDGNNTPYRTMVCYKETFLDVNDPKGPDIWTGTWRDTRFSPPGDGGRPENELKGNIFQINGDFYSEIKVPARNGKMRFWRNTSVASQAAGAATLAPGSLGAEVDGDLDNGFRPAGLVQLSNNIITDPSLIVQESSYGVSFGPGTVNHKILLYKHASGALVFSTGSYGWSWGLDKQHDNSSHGSTTNQAMQQATVNLFADMGVQPVSLQSNLVLASASDDTTPPSSEITSPVTGSTIAPGSTLTVKGQATDNGGVIGGVEISTNGGITWHPVEGLDTWSYTWKATGNKAIIQSRAVDDSGNLETPSAGISVLIGNNSDSIPPSKPSALTALATSSSQINLSWENSTDNIAVTSYQVERCKGSGCTTFKIIAKPTNNQLMDTGLVAGSIYKYRVLALDGAGNKSGYSDIASAKTLTTTDAISPSSPTNLIATAVSSSQINLSWSISTDNVAVTNYQLERCKGVGCTDFIIISTPTSNQYVDIGLSANALYQYRVLAKDAAGNTSAYSTIATASTLGITNQLKAVDDTFLFRLGIPRTVDKTGPFGFGVLSNDTNPTNTPLSAKVVGSLPTGVNLNSNGVVSINRSSTATFRYRVSDGTNLSLPTNGALTKLKMDLPPTVTKENCTYDKNGSGSIISGTACTMAGLNKININLISNDIDPNSSFNVPSDGVGNVVKNTIITSTGNNVAVEANEICGQTAIVKSSTYASITNNCDGTIKISITASAPTTTLNFTYVALDDLGAKSLEVADAISIQ